MRNETNDPFLCGHRAILLWILLTVTLPFSSGCWQTEAPQAPPQSGKTTDLDAPVQIQDESSPSSKSGTSPKVAALTTKESGQQLYARHCAACHGEQGDGKGLAANYVFPKPRDFQAGRFRLVSTSNNVPSRDDLHGVLLRGMPGSSMPPWGHLTQSDRDALVDEVMRLRSEGAKQLYVKMLKEEEDLDDEEIAAADIQEDIVDFAKGFTTPGESTSVPEISLPDDAALAHGKELYAKNGCLQCHGKDGKGDGVQKMVDDEKFPTTARDFTLGIFKGGHDVASLYRRIAYGMPGTPMPSSKQMTPEQMLDVVHYIRSMSTDEQREATVLNRAEIIVTSVRQLPDEPTSAAWADVAAVTLRMTPLWWRNNANTELKIQALHDGKTIAVKISWRDDSSNRHAAKTEAFEDAVAMELYRGDAEPFIGMGDPRAPIDVWFWDADRQAVVDVEDEYPRVVVDIYPFSETQVDTAEFRRAGTKLANQPEMSLPALASGNQISPGHATSGGSSLTGGGPGSSTFRLPKSQIVSAQGTWQEGYWHVVLTRMLVTASPGDGISLEPGGKASVAFAVWDGSQQDRDGKKLITIWQDLILEK